MTTRTYGWLEERGLSLHQLAPLEPAPRPPWGMPSHPVHPVDVDAQPADPFVAPPVAAPTHSW